MSTAAKSDNVLLIKGGRVYDHRGDIDQPPVADILIVGDSIAAVRAGLADAIAGSGQPMPELGGRKVGETIDAADRLIVPGFVNAHYHSHDVLLKGCFETIPLELWVLSALPPSYPKRNTAEIRARTLLGAVECLRSGITTVQDLATIYPFDEEHLDAMLKAYDDVGIRCIFALQIADVPGVKSIPFWDEVVPADQRGGLSGAVEPFRNIDLRVLVRDLVKTRRNVSPRITWALGPSSPERCSEELLSSLAEFSADEKLPVYTHIYESKAMTLIARQTHAKDDGSLINYLDRVGLLTPKLSLAHSVWMTPREIGQLQENGTNVVLNPVGNLKTRSGIAPIRSYMRQGVNVGLGCDNCSCSDAQNMFQSMKMFASLGGGLHAGAGAADRRRCHLVGDDRRRAHSRAGGAHRRAEAGHGRRPVDHRPDRPILRSAQQRGAPTGVHRIRTVGRNRHRRRSRGGARPQDHHHRRARPARGGRRADEGAAQGHRRGHRPQPAHDALFDGGAPAHLGGRYRPQPLCRRRHRLIAFVRSAMKAPPFQYARAESISRSAGPARRIQG